MLAPAPCSDALDMARQVDPEGRRTIGGFGRLIEALCLAVLCRRAGGVMTCDDVAAYGDHGCCLLSWCCRCMHSSCSDPVRSQDRPPSLAAWPNVALPQVRCSLSPGVLTKLDIMDRGTDAVAVLKNETVPLALGFVGVVLRR